MDSLELATKLIEEGPRFKPNSFADDFNKGDKGINFVLHTLVSADRPLLFGEIAKQAPFSTARLAVLLNKMEERQLVTRKSHEKDARKTMVEITETGRALHEEIKNKLIHSFAKVIDKMGQEDVLELHRLLNKLFDCMKETRKECE